MEAEVELTMQGSYSEGLVAIGVTEDGLGA